MKTALYLLCFGISLSCFSQYRISIEDFTTKATFAQKTVSNINWMKDGKFYTALANNKVIRYNIETGEAVETLVNGNELSTSVKIEGYSLSADEKKVLLMTNKESIYRWSYAANYFIVDVATKSVQPLSGGGKQSYATFSPDGSQVAFVRENNLFIVDLVTMREKPITTDGRKNEVINGTTDWVYEEEFSFVVGFSWSPNNRRIAYYRFDESQVPQYNMQMWGNELYPKDYRFKYPKAGEQNASVEIWCYDGRNDNTMKLDIGDEKEFYVPRMKWTNDPNKVAIQKLNRLQNKLSLLHADAISGKSTIIVEEESKTYVDIDHTDELIYTRDNRHLLRASEVSGYKHLYFYTTTGKLVTQVTQGTFDVAEVIGLDEKTKTVYYTAFEESPMEKHLYSVSFSGKKKRKLTQQNGIHKIDMSRDYQYYIDHHSSATQPLHVTLYKTKSNTVIKTLEKNEALAKRVEEYGLAKKEFFTIKAEDGSAMYAYMLKPNDFVAGKKYPVVVHQYSGPGSVYVTNQWEGKHFYFHQALVDKGYIVVAIDPRGTGQKGADYKKVTYKQLGKIELEDLLTTGKYLASLPYIDAARMGIWGWSYGGYMTSLVMTKGAGLYKLGIAVSPVTNWRFYDTIYTERFLQTPQLNPEGYDDNSPLTHAAKLSGEFLLIHGTGDDNVHFQNSVRFQEALINSGKQFQSFYYPDKNHSIPGGKSRHHLYSMMLSFITERL